MQKFGAPFKGLRKALRERKKTLGKRVPGPAAGALPSAPEPPMDDEACFREAMKDVCERSEFRVLPVTGPKTPPVKPLLPSDRDEAAEAEHELGMLVSKKRGITLSDTDEYMEWAAPSLSPHKRASLTRSLHEGRYAVSDFIDLHGLTEDDAWEELTDFMDRARKRKFSCIKVIHGRGLRSPAEPVLKSAVKRWLKGPLSKYVTAFATARACDGGLGATYVLLKR